mmetsp:Transcript_24364/g.49448  ORF Transcript_24364/g.49448 Transcript_24364/m.49448 type:complete len:103 (+) Transcript_24364:182-490(+)
MRCDAGASLTGRIRLNPPIHFHGGDFDALGVFQRDVDGIVDDAFASELFHNILACAAQFCFCANDTASCFVVVNLSFHDCGPDQGNFVGKQGHACGARGGLR